MELTNQITEEYNKRIAHFIEQNSPQILQELENDKKYQTGVTEIPTIPLFDNFMERLHKSLSKKTNDRDIVNYVQTQKNKFYYTTLPELSYANLVYQ